MLSNAINPVDSGEPVWSVKSLSSDMNAVPQDRMFLQRNSLNHKADHVGDLAPRRVDKWKEIRLKSHH